MEAEVPRQHTIPRDVGTKNGEDRLRVPEAAGPSESSRAHLSPQCGTRLKTLKWIVQRKDSLRSSWYVFSEISSFLLLTQHRLQVFGKAAGGPESKSVTSSCPEKATKSSVAEGKAHALSWLSRPPWPSWDCRCEPCEVLAKGAQLGAMLPG